MRILCLLAVVFVSISSFPAFGADSSIFYKGGVISLDEPEVKITKIYGFRLFPVNVTLKSGKEIIYVTHGIENLSNTANTLKVDITMVSQSKGWSAELILDDNGDGIPQPNETRKLEGSQVIGEGSTLFFFVKMKRPAGAVSGDSGFAAVRVTGSIKDGNEYIGNNGLRYGGPDEAETTDTVLVE